MKKIIIFSAILSLMLSSQVYAQFSTPTVGTTTRYSQLWNPASFYYNTVTDASQVGKQLDTVTNATSLNLESSNFYFAAAGDLATYVLPGSSRGLYTVTNNDTVIVSPIEGNGQITLTCSVYKCTGTPTVNVIPISSSDGIVWAPIEGATAGTTLSVTVNPTSLTVPVTTKWTLPNKPDRYVGVEMLNVGGSTSISGKAWFYYLRPETLTKQL